MESVNNNSCLVHTNFGNGPERIPCKAYINLLTMMRYPPTSLTFTNRGVKHSFPELSRTKALTILHCALAGNITSADLNRCFYDATDRSMPYSNQK